MTTNRDTPWIVAPHGKQWAIRRSEADSELHLYDTREEAQNHAILLAQDAGVDALIQDEYGQVEDEVSLIDPSAPDGYLIGEEATRQGRLMMADMTTGLWDKIAGNWKQFKGDVRVRWGKLTDDDMERIAGQRDILEGRIQEAYGVSREEAGKQIDEWQHKLNL